MKNSFRDKLARIEKDIDLTEYKPITSQAAQQIARDALPRLKSRLLAANAAKQELASHRPTTGRSGPSIAGRLVPLSGWIAAGIAILCAAAPELKRQGWPEFKWKWGDGQIALKMIYRAAAQSRQQEMPSPRPLTNSQEGSGGISTPLMKSEAAVPPLTAIETPPSTEACCRAETPSSKTWSELLTTDYEVKQGDTYSSLAEDHLGDARRWKEIATLNPKIIPTKMRPRVVIRIPIQIAGH